MDPNFTQNKSPSSNNVIRGLILIPSHVLPPTLIVWLFLEWIMCTLVLRCLLELFFCLDHSFPKYLHRQLLLLLVGLLNTHLLNEAYF